MSGTTTSEGDKQLRAKPTRSIHRAVSLQSRAILVGTRFGIKPLMTAWMAAPDLPWPTGLVDEAARWLPRPRHTRVREVALPNCRAEWLRAKGSGTARAILYLHGGGFVMCGLNTHRS